MKSIKPGRGPSGMAAGGGIIGVVFGILWTVMAFFITRDAPSSPVRIIFPLFGVVFVIAGIVNVAYHLRNATAQDRFSLLDITSQEEEPDPLNTAFGNLGDDYPFNDDEPISDRLAKIDELRNKGLISEEEHAIQRERILNEI